MRVVLFIKSGVVEGVITCSPALYPSPEQIAKLNARGYTTVVWEAPLATHDGNINQFVDTLLETGSVGFGTKA